MAYITQKDLRDATTNLKSDFDFLISIIKNPDDFEIVREAIEKAFSCIPNAGKLPSQQLEAKGNEALAMESFHDFLSKLPEDIKHHDS